MIWSSRPFVRIFFPLVAGIFLAYWFPFFRESGSLWLLILTGVLSFTAYLLYRKNRSWKWRWLNGMLFILAVMSVGVFLTNMKLEKDTSFLNSNEQNYVAKVVSEPVSTEKSVKMILRLERTVSEDTIRINGTRVMAFLHRDSLSRKLQYGDIIVFKGKPVAPEGPKNPEEFDYAAFLALNDVHAMVFLRQDDWNLLGSDEGSIYVLSARTRNYLWRALPEIGVTGKNYT
ncbi:MAG: hypothetical protein DRI72_02965, partial [Bacteroidetes bacterium]